MVKLFALIPNKSNESIKKLEIDIINNYPDEEYRNKLFDLIFAKEDPDCVAIIKSVKSSIERRELIQDSFFR